MSSFYRRSSYRSIELTVGPAYWTVLGATALLALAQTTLVPLAAIRGAVPSLVTIAVVLYASRTGARRGALLAVPAGLLEDIFAGNGGGWTIATTVVALLVGAISRRIDADGALAGAVLCALASIVRDGVFWATMALEGYPHGFAGAHLHVALLRAVYTAVVAWVWLAVRRRIVGDATTVERYP